VHDTNDQVAKKRNRLLDDVEVSKVKGVKTAGVKRDGHIGSYAIR
jgi:hypothetical protein